MSRSLEHRTPTEIYRERGTPQDVFRLLCGRIAEGIASEWDTLTDPACSIEGHATMEPAGLAHAWKITIRVEAATPDHLAEMDRGAPAPETPQ